MYPYFYPPNGKEEPHLKKRKIKPPNGREAISISGKVDIMGGFIWKRFANEIYFGREICGAPSP